MKQRDRAGGLPYEMVFDADFEQAHFTAIAAEADQNDVPTWRPDRFLLMRAVAAPLREALSESPGTAVERFGPLLFQGYHFWQFRKQLFALEELLFRHLVGDLPPIGAWDLTPPAAAGYLHFPRNLLWARVAEGAQPEAVDGLFWTMVGVNDPLTPPFARVDVLLVLGMMPGRPGFTVAPLSLELEQPSGHWGDAQMRPNPPDFANVLPGGELQKLHALETTGEVWKLISRVFWYCAQQPTALDPETGQLRLVNASG